MIKFLDILKEIYLNEKIVKVPQEILDKSKEAFNYIKNNLDKLKSKSKGKNWNNPYIDPKFKNYFQFKDLKNQDLKVTIGFYNNDQDPGVGRMNTQDDILLINLPFFTDFEEFEDTVEHELVHAMDPKVRDVEIFGRLYTKKGAEPDQIEKYIKSPWEFDAYTAPLINKLVYNIKKSPDYKNTLISLLSDIKSKSIEDIIDNEKYEQMPYFFTKREWDEKNFSNIYNEYISELTKIKTWTNKPTLYKRFLKRLGTEL